MKYLQAVLCRTFLSLQGWIVCAVVAFSNAAVWAQGVPPPCGSIANAYGPFDYRTGRASLRIVEEYHFSPEVESLIGGKSGTIGADLDYTLRASPNHHRALIAMMRLGKKYKTDMPPSARYTVECYFERAMRFQPDDTISRMLYATYLVENNRKVEAAAQLKRSSAMAGDSGFTHYNIGLVYFDMSDFEDALAEAHIAISMGFTRTELRDKLEKAGKWRELTEKTDSVATPASAASQPQSTSN